MSKVFISGSIVIKHLPELVKESIKNIIANNMEILVGDADGIDIKVQNFCKKLNYNNITVYSIYSYPRNIVNGFNYKKVDISDELKKERARQQVKDAAMTEDSDYSLIIWDGESKGSYKNILRAIDSNKKVKLYLHPSNKFLEAKKINKNEVEFIYRENVGYTASEVVDYLKSTGEEYFPQTRAFNKYLLDTNILLKDGEIYKPVHEYEHLFLINKYRGKVNGVKFRNEFIDWIENKLKKIKEPEQENLFNNA